MISVKFPFTNALTIKTEVTKVTKEYILVLNDEPKLSAIELAF